MSDQPVSIDDARRRQKKNDGAGRVPPHNLGAEESLLGACLLSRDAIAAALDVLGTVGADAFHKPTHGHIYDATLACYNRSAAVDAITVGDELARRGLLDVCGGPVELNRLLVATPATSNAGRYARIILEHHQLRRMISAAGEIAELGYSVPDDVDSALDRAEQLLFELKDRQDRRAAAPLAAGLATWLDRYHTRAAAGDVAGISTGMRDLDRKLLGLRPGQLVVVAARPGMGKSHFGAAVTVGAARHGHPVLLMSAEMSRDELEDRFVAAEGVVELSAIREARVQPADLHRLDRAVTTLAEFPVLVDDSATVTLLSIRAQARRAVALYGWLDLIVVDYLQILTPHKTQDRREREVAELSRGLKVIAKELDVAVVALCQLNREVEQRRDKRPQLSDLRESGSIENDADVVISLYRDDYYNPESRDAGILEANVLKQRNGPTGIVRLAYEPRYGTIRDLAPGGAP